MSHDTAKVTVYRTAYCPFCVAAERLLKSKELSFEQVYLDDHPDPRGFVDGLLPGHRTVPLVVIDDQPVGGYDQLAALEAQGRLDELLRIA